MKTLWSEIHETDWVSTNKGCRKKNCHVVGQSKPRHNLVISHHLWCRSRLSTTLLCSSTLLKFKVTDRRSNFQFQRCKTGSTLLTVAWLVIRFQSSKPSKILHTFKKDHQKQTRPTHTCTMSYVGNLEISHYRQLFQSKSNSYSQA